jgi:hypothetical protein
MHVFFSEPGTEKIESVELPFTRDATRTALKPFEHCDAGEMGNEPIARLPVVKVVDTGPIETYAIGQVVLRSPHAMPFVIIFSLAQFPDGKKRSVLKVQLMLGLLHPCATAVIAGPKVVENISFVKVPVIEPPGHDPDTSIGG